MADEGHKGQHLVLEFGHKMPKIIQNQGLCTNKYKDYSVDEFLTVQISMATVVETQSEMEFKSVLNPN